MKTKEEQEKLRNLGKASKKLMRELHDKKLYASCVGFSDKQNVFVVYIANVPLEYEGYPVIVEQGTAIFAKK